LIRVVGGETDDGVGSDDAAGVGRKEIFLAQVKARVEEAGVIGAVVDDEEGTGVVAKGCDFLGLREDFATPECFVAKLEDVCTTFEKGRRGFDRVEAQALQGCGVEDWINTGEIQRMIVPRWK